MLALVFIVHGGLHSTPHGVSLPKILASILATLILPFTQHARTPSFMTSASAARRHVINGLVVSTSHHVTLQG
jgi:hypothetical protein